MPIEWTIGGDFAPRKSLKEQDAERLIREAAQAFWRAQGVYDRLADGRAIIRECYDKLARAKDLGVLTEEPFAVMCENHNITPDAFSRVEKLYEKWEGKVPINIAYFDNTGRVLYDAWAWTGIGAKRYERLDRFSASRNSQLKNGPKP